MLKTKKKYFFFIGLLILLIIYLFSFAYKTKESVKTFDISSLKRQFFNNQKDFATIEVEHVTEENKQIIEEKVIDELKANISANLTQEFKKEYETKGFYFRNLDQNLIESTNLDDKINRYLKSHLNCFYTPLTQTVKQRGKYWVFYNYIRAEVRNDCYNTVTYTTQGEYSFLDNLIPIVERWLGPISVAVYAPGDDYYKTLDSIAYLRQCKTDLIKKYITFHLFFDESHIPKKIFNESYALHRQFNCSEEPPYMNVNSSTTYRTRNKLLYPINVGRNIARDMAQTHFILPSDIELYPSPEFIPNFMQMIARNKGPLLNKNPRVFVLPVFEIESDFEVPRSKTELRQMWWKGLAIRFHQNICDVCHFVPNLFKWVRTEETQGLSVFHVAKRTGRYNHWEPFYVGTKNDPYYDERMTWEGMKDKHTQGYALCVLDYDFQILDNAFLIHRPGIKQPTKDPYRKMMAQKTEILIKEHILPELTQLYGSRKECRI